MFTGTEKLKEVCQVHSKFYKRFLGFSHVEFILQKSKNEEQVDYKRLITMACTLKVIM